MCFSAEASFIAAAGLAVIGGVTFKQAPSRSFLPMASISLIFSLQQFIEGVLWLSLDEGASFTWVLQPCIYMYLVFATVIWPTFLPYMFWRVENDSRKRSYIFYVLAFGFLITIYNLLMLVMKDHSISIVNHSIQYSVDNSLWHQVVYALAVIPAFFISSLKHAWWVGVLGVVSFVLTQIFSAMTFTSLWCFFAALMSVLFYFIVKSANSPKYCEPMIRQTCKTL
jgi:hypothetical protein